MEPNGTIAISPLGYLDTALNEIHRHPLIETSDHFHPTKHMIVQQNPGFVGDKNLSGYGTINDLLIEDVIDPSSGVKPTELVSNYAEDMAQITYKDGTRLNNQIILLERMGLRKQQPKKEPNKEQPEVMQVPTIESIESIRQVNNDLGIQLSEAIARLRPAARRERGPPLRPRQLSEHQQVMRELMAEGHRGRIGDVLDE